MGIVVALVLFLTASSCTLDAGDYVESELVQACEFIIGVDAIEGEPVLEVEDSSHTVWVEDSVDITDIILSIKHSAVSIEPDPSTIRDYSKPVLFTFNCDSGLVDTLTVVAKYKPWQLVLAEAPFAPRDGAGLVEFNGRMWLLGGWNPSAFDGTTTNEVWSSTDGSTWEQHATPPWEGRHCAGFVTFQDKIWVIGGDNNRGYYQNDVWSSENGDDWNLITDAVPWADRVMHYVAVHNNKLYVIGGEEVNDIPDVPDTVYNDVWVSSDGANWDNILDSAPWLPRGQIQGYAILDSSIWIVGGGTYQYPRNYYNDVWSSTDGLDWNSMNNSAPFLPRQYHSILVYNGALWVLGGFNSNFEPDECGNLGDSWYSIDGIEWKQLIGPGWKNRHATSAISFNGTIFVIAGSINGSSPVNDVWKLSSNY